MAPQLMTFLFAQETSTTPNDVFAARVIDGDDLKAISYATIFNKTSGYGTITNLEGFFSLENCKASDTIVISFIGYEKKKVVVGSLSQNEKIYLMPKTELLDEVIILADDALLYNLVFDSRKTYTNTTKVGRTYFLLDSKVNEQQVELVECYYNGHFTGYDINEMNLKNGRVALAHFENRLFVSTETSKALSYHKLYTKSTLFPFNPFQLSRSKLRRQYELNLSSKYINDDQSTIYVITFLPKRDHKDYFEGRVWLDSADAKIVKVELDIENANIYPFIPHGNVDSLLKVDMYISKTFTDIDERMFVKSVDFNYVLKYRTSNDSVIDVATNAVLYAYKYDSIFTPPFFQYSKGMYEDYRKINATPYNDFFWDNTKEFKLKNRFEENERFIKDHASITNKTLFTGNNYFDRGLFEHPYVFWSNKRILLKEDFEEESITDYKTFTLSERYKLKIQIFLDVNSIDDSVHILTSTVFDPFESFYHFPMTAEGNTFINMYFDLVEVYRRKLVKEIEVQGRDVATVKRIYSEIDNEINAVSLVFFKEVDRGTNRNGMEKWNRYLYDKLGIDNLKIFKPYDDAKTENLD